MSPRRPSSTLWPMRLVSAYKRSPGAAEEARVTIDQDTGEIKVYGQELDEDGNVTREWGGHAERLRSHRCADRKAGHPAAPA